MPSVRNWNLSQQSRERMAVLLNSAAALGIDPEAVAVGGLAGLQALIALQGAQAADAGDRRDHLILRAQHALRGLDPGMHGTLIQQFQARILALQGRGGDTEIAHVTDGEIVLPKALQTPAVLGALRDAVGKNKVDLEKLRVGSAMNSINPRTGQPEFFSIWPQGTAGYDMCKHGLQTDRCGERVPDFLKDKPDLYMPTPEDLSRLSDEQKEEYARFYEGTGSSEDVLGGALPHIGRLYGGVRRLILRGMGKAAEQDAATRGEIAKAYRGGIKSPKTAP